MKWPLGNSGATYLRYVTDTVQTVQYSDSQCTVQVYTKLPPRQPLTSRSLSTLVLFLSLTVSRLVIYLNIWSTKAALQVPTRAAYNNSLIPKKNGFWLLVFYIATKSKYCMYWYYVISNIHIASSISCLHAITWPLMDVSDITKLQGGSLKPMFLIASLRGI